MKVFHFSIGEKKNGLASKSCKREFEGCEFSDKDVAGLAVDAAKQAREIAQISGELANAIAKLGSSQSDMDDVSSTITRENLKLVRMIQKNLKLTGAPR